jgi:hypothetical protein
MFVIPQPFYLSFRSEAEESAFSRRNTVYTITQNALNEIWRTYARQIEFVQAASINADLGCICSIVGLQWPSVHQL